jgi:aromatic amino acid aminotransferase I
METALPLGVKCIPARMDGYSLVPNALDEMLRSCDEAQAGKRPRVIYLVPTGQNASGATASLARRREVYAVVQRCDLYILEDGPYYFVQFGPTLRAKKGGNAPCSPSELAKALTPSYLSMDTDGRMFGWIRSLKYLLLGCGWGGLQHLSKCLGG